MDVSKMIAELRSELEEINGVILALERLSLGSGKRRGRPPKWMSAARDAEQVESAEPASAPAAKQRKKKRVFSAETKRKMAEAQRKRWAAANAAEGKGGEPADE